MLFLPDLLNRHELFLALNGLDQRNSKFGEIKESIINHGTDAFLRMERIRALNDLILGEFDLFADQMSLRGEEVIVFASRSMGALLMEISPFLATLRILQNKTLALISAQESVSLPSSMSDFCKKVERYRINSDVRELILMYWESSGKHVKFYRDIDQHDFDKTELISRYFIRIAPEPITYVEIPDYQKILKKSEFTYENKINALEFFDEAGFQIHSLIEAISTSYGAEQKLHADSIRLGQLGDLTPWRYRTLAVMLENKMERRGEENAMNIGAIRLDQNEEGKPVLQRMFLSEDKLGQAKILYGIR